MITGNHPPLNVDRRRKLALVLPGAVSLGSFEAGVVDALLEALEAPVPPPFSIDILVGTSAGAMVAALAGLHLSRGACRERLKVWTRVTMDGLTDFSRPRPDPRRWPYRDPRSYRSLLSSAYIEKLARDNLLEPVSGPPGPGGAGEILVKMAVSRMDPIPHPRRYFGIYSTDLAISESISFRLKPGWRLPGIGAENRLWERIAGAAVASGAFPVAFDPVAISYCDRLASVESWESASAAERGIGVYPYRERSYYYTDGGVLDNRPLKRAMDAIRELGGNAPVFDPERLIVFVLPRPSDQGRTGAPPQPPDLVYGLKGRRPDPEAFEVYRRVRWMLSLNASNPELKQADDENRRIEALLKSVDDLLSGLTQAKPAAPLAVNGRFTRFFHPPAELDPDLLVPDQHDREIIELWRSIRSKFRRHDPDGQRLVIGFADQLAANFGLTDRRWIPVERIAPERPEEELAGEALGHFMGFVSPDYLKHDFEAGRRRARAWLAEAFTNWHRVHGSTLPAPTLRTADLGSVGLRHLPPRSITWGVRILHRLARQKNPFPIRWLAWILLAVVTSVAGLGFLFGVLLRSLFVN